MTSKNFSKCIHDVKHLDKLISGIRLSFLKFKFGKNASDKLNQIRHLQLQQQVILSFPHSLNSFNRIEKPHVDDNLLTNKRVRHHFGSVQENINGKDILKAADDSVSAFANAVFGDHDIGV